LIETTPLQSRADTQTLEHELDRIERVVDEPMTIQMLAERSGFGLNTTRRLAASLASR
jgi:hypothetical protein